MTSNNYNTYHEPIYLIGSGSALKNVYQFCSGAQKILLVLFLSFQNIGANNMSVREAPLQHLK